MRNLLLRTSHSRSLQIQKMKIKSQHGANLPEELDLLHQARQHRRDESDRGSHPSTKPRSEGEKTSMPAHRLPSRKKMKNQRRVFFFRNWKGFQVLPEIGRRRSRCLVCLQVHQIKDLPVSMNGRAVVVGWRTKGWEGEETLPVPALEGKASFDEIFLHYCNVKMPCAMKNFTIWVSLVEAKHSDLGTFILNLGELMLAGESNSKFSGKTTSFNLCGVAAGAILGVSFYYTIIDKETRGFQQMQCNSNGPNQNKSKCFSCLPDLKYRKNRSLAGSTRRVASLESDLGFITIENSTENCCRATNDDDEGFITIEKGIECTRSWRPPSDNSSSSEGDEKENPCVWSEVYEESEVDQVQDEFLKMLEEKQGKTEEFEIISNAIVPWEKEMKELGEKLNLELGFDLDLDLDLDLVLRAAENEVLKATQVWKSRVGARALEKAEYEELLRKWRKDGETLCGFGSPI